VPEGIVKRLAYTVLVLLLVSACGNSGNNGGAPSGPPPVNGWTSDQVNSNMQGCVSTLQGLPNAIAVTKINSICYCWVSDVENSFTPDQADIDSNTPQVQAYLNGCAQSAGIQTPLAFSRQKWLAMFGNRGK